MRGAVAVVTRLVARMRATPCPEVAAAFAADGEGPAAARLATAVRAARGTGRTGLVEWAGECDAPAVERAVTLVEAAAAAPRDERRATLDRARAVVLEGARDEAADAVAALRGPATALYAFGVVLPLALVAVLPAAEVAGVVASVPLIVAVYDVALPLTLCAAGWRLLAERPIAIAVPAVGRTHPDVPEYPVLATCGGLAAGAGAGLLARAVLPPWTVSLGALGATAGTWLVFAAGPYVRVHDRVDAAERDLPDACSLVGAAVADGTAVERAVADTADDLGGPTGAVLEAAVARQDRLGIDLESAFLGPHGALRHLPSTWFRDAAALFAVAGAEGRPAGDALADLGDHLEDLHRVEQEVRRDLRQLTATLSNTAAAFAPLVGGATVAMASAFGEALAVGALGLAVGTYVLVLAGVLAGLSVGLERGWSPGHAGRRAGLAVLTATGTYLVAFVAAGAVT